MKYWHRMHYWPISIGTYWWFFTTVNWPDTRSYDTWKDAVARRGWGRRRCHAVATTVSSLQSLKCWLNPPLNEHKCLFVSFMLPGRASRGLWLIHWYHVTRIIHLTMPETEKHLKSVSVWKADWYSVPQCNKCLIYVLINLTCSRMQTISV